MKDIILTVAAILAILIALPVLILWFRDRGGVVGVAVQKTLGALALLMGLAIIGWVAFNVFAPTEEFRSSYKTVFQFAVPIFMVWLGWHWLTDRGPGIEDIPADFTCDELRASVERAKETLPWFLEQVDKNVDGAFVKFPLTTPNDLTEHIWAYVHSFRNGVFNVSLANNPIDEDQESSGRRDVPIDQVEDWQIMYPDGPIKGAYSLIALFQHFESTGKKLSRKMRNQKAQLIDAEPAAEDGVSQRD